MNDFRMRERMNERKRGGGGVCSHKCHWNTLLTYIYVMTPCYRCAVIVGNVPYHFLPTVGHLVYHDLIVELANVMPANSYKSPFILRRKKRHAGFISHVMTQK